MPHTFTGQNCVMYTGTHDNDTMQGWLENLGDEQLQLVCEYLYGKKLSVDLALCSN